MCFYFSSQEILFLILISVYACSNASPDDLRSESGNHNHAPAKIVAHDHSEFGQEDHADSIFTNPGQIFNITIHGPETRTAGSNFPSAGEAGPPVENDLSRSRQALFSRFLGLRGKSVGFDRIVAFSPFLAKFLN